MIVRGAYESGGWMRPLILFTAFILLFSFSFMTYSTTGYTFTKYPKVEGDVIVCVEGEVDPTNQTITIINDGEVPTVKPWVRINGKIHQFDSEVAYSGVSYETYDIKLGCNRIKFGAESETQFKVRLNYLSHWRPLVKRLEVSNMLVGLNSRYFIATEDADNRQVVKSRLKITDITERVFQSVVLDREFEGSSVMYKIVRPGNYRAEMQVYDGSVWSDFYGAVFTSHLISTGVYETAYREDAIKDDEVVEQDAYVPVAIKPEDNKRLIMFKRVLNGGYVLATWTADFVLGKFEAVKGMIP
ncbi:MAG: hypothetical protein V1744_00115 [Candidatus Altiarchaeota archaeon]